MQNVIFIIFATGQNNKIGNREIIPRLQSQILTRIQDLAQKIDQYYTYIINKSPFKPFFNMTYLVSLQQKIILTKIFHIIFIPFLRRWFQISLLISLTKNLSLRISNFSSRFSSFYQFAVSLNDLI